MNPGYYRTRNGVVVQHILTEEELALDRLHFPSAAGIPGRPLFTVAEEHIMEEIARRHTEMGLPGIPTFLTSQLNSPLPSASTSQQLGIPSASTSTHQRPPPFCSCTGKIQPCTKLKEAWRSVCCTKTISQYPLPINPSSRNRISGRSMTFGVYETLLKKLDAEGNDPFKPVDLKNHWSRKGSNQHVIFN